MTGCACHTCANPARFVSVWAWEGGNYYSAPGCIYERTCQARLINLYHQYCGNVSPNFTKCWTLLASGSDQTWDLPAAYITCRQRLPWSKTDVYTSPSPLHAYRPFVFRPSSSARQSSLWGSCVVPEFVFAWWTLLCCCCCVYEVATLVVLCSILLPVPLDLIDIIVVPTTYYVHKKWGQTSCSTWSEAFLCWR